jgi:hypothetical protein
MNKSTDSLSVRVVQTGTSRKRDRYIDNVDRHKDVCVCVHTYYIETDLFQGIAHTIVKAGKFKICIAGWQFVQKLRLQSWDTISSFIEKLRFGS